MEIKKIAPDGRSFKGKFTKKVKKTKKTDFFAEIGIKRCF